MQTLTVLGATGSIGLNTLDIVRQHRDKFSIYALTCHRQIDKLLALSQEFEPECVVITSEQAAEQSQQLLAQFECAVHVGAEYLETVAQAPEVNMVMAAIVGAAGLMPTLVAAKNSKTILLANKESLVMTGDLLLSAVRENGAKLLPVDSEHNAIFQSLDNYAPEKTLAEQGIRRLILTASGGPFRQFSAEQMYSVTPEQACAHPNWKMGRKISVDSASMMNKGLELIEAKWLFNAKPEQIEVIIQPQSVIHSMVEYTDGSVIAELGVPDMRTPIANVMGLPKRLDTNVQSLDFIQLAKLEFCTVDNEKFPCLQLAYRALEEGGTASACLNAANEVAVEAFLAGKIGFVDIATVIEQTMNIVESMPADSIVSVLTIDAQARQVASQLLKS